MRTAVKRHKMNQAELLQNDHLHLRLFGEEGNRYVGKSVVLMRTAERKLRSHYWINWWRYVEGNLTKNLKQLVSCNINIDWTELREAVITVRLRHGCKIFPEIYEPPQTSRWQKGDVKHVSYWRPANIWRHGTRFCSHGELETGFCTALDQGMHEVSLWK